MKQEIINWIIKNTIFNRIEKTNDGLKGYYLYSDIYGNKIYIHYSKNLNTFYIDIDESFKGLKEFKKALLEY